MARYPENINILIDSYAEFYGLEYRQYIENCFKDIQIEFILNFNSPLNVKNIVLNNKNTRLLLSYFNLRERIICRERRLGKGGIAKLIQFSSLKLIKPHNNGYTLLKEFLDVPTMAFVHGIRDKAKMYLPIYFVNNIIIIHEFSHTISTPDTESNNIFPYSEVDEIINQLVSIDVTQIFESKKGNFVEEDFEILSVDDAKSFLMRDFYIKFIDLIKECLIKRDITILEDNLGKSYLDKYFLLVKKLYYHKEVSQNDMRKLQFLVLLMEENLKRKGKRVRRISK